MALQLKRVPAARGARWIGDAFRLFGRRPFPFTLMFSVFLFTALVAASVPGLGVVLQLALLPLLSLGFMVAGQAALQDRPMGPRSFIEPLREPGRRRSLLLMCLLFGVAGAAILLLADAASGQAMGRLQRLMAQGAEAQPEIDMLLAEPGLRRAVMLGLAGGLALSVPFWHAPALVHWAGQGVAQALFSSTLAVWRAKGAFVVYFATGFAVLMMFGILSAVILGALGGPRLVAFVTLPAGLMFSTVFYVSLIFVFNDSFGGVAGVQSALPAAADAGEPPG
jgi:hypothetical protein